MWHNLQGSLLKIPTPGPPHPAPPPCPPACWQLALGPHSPVLQEGEQVPAAHACLVKGSLRVKGLYSLPVDRSLCLHTDQCGLPGSLLRPVGFLQERSAAEYGTTPRHCPGLSGPETYSRVLPDPLGRFGVLDMLPQSCLDLVALGKLRSSILQGSATKGHPGRVPTPPRLTLGAPKFPHLPN